MVFGARLELATMRTSTARVYQIAPPEHWWVVKDSNLGDPKGIPRLQRGAFGLSANCPKRIVKDLAEGRRLERLCPEGPWLSRPVGYQLPEPSRHNFKSDLKGNYRLDERHQDRPTVSRYDRRPRLSKRRIRSYFKAEKHSSQDSICSRKYGLEFQTIPEHGGERRVSTRGGRYPWNRTTAGYSPSARSGRCWALDQFTWITTAVTYRKKRERLRVPRALRRVYCPCGHTWVPTTGGTRNDIMLQKTSPGELHG